MLAGLAELAQAYLAVLNPTSILFGLGGALTGILVGCLPGLSATLCIALLTTMTVKLPANDAILILVCSYVGTLYGGSRSAILLNIPGTAANAASCADGHALARRGEAGRAIGIATSGAFTGVLFGVFCLAALTPVLARVALSFGSYEFFWLALFGVTMSGRIVGNDPVKGWLMGLLGLFVAQIGQDGLYAHDRFTFGLVELSGGISLIPALVGAFGFSEILTTLANPTGVMVELKDLILPRFREVAQYRQTALRSGAVGVLTGLLPGIGEDAGAWMSYAAARVSQRRAHPHAMVQRLECRFLRCNPQRLYLPVMIDPEYHYEAINVETQQNNPHSLLWWTKRVLAQRKQLRPLGRGSIEFLYPKIAAFWRSCAVTRTSMCWSSRIFPTLRSAAKWTWQF